MSKSLAWEGSDNEFTVVGHLVRRHAGQFEESAIQVPRTRYLRPVSRSKPWSQSAESNWGPSVLAFLFALPDSEAIRAIERSSTYFNIRTGNTWDLFVPGYIHNDGSPSNDGAPEPDWVFDPTGFDAMRRHIEEESARRWQYSGGSDLVLINTWLQSNQPPVIDWESTASGSLTETIAGRSSLSLAQVIERISRDLEQGLEDPAYGVGDLNSVERPRRQDQKSLIRELFIATTSEIAASIAAKQLGQ